MEPLEFGTTLGAYSYKHGIMKTILVPTDFSPSAKNATDYAARLCNALNCKMVLLNAYMLPVPVTDVPYVMLSASEMQAEYEEGLRKEANRLFELFEIEVEAVVELGVPEDEILEFAREKGADLIVMGMKGADSLDKLLGSTTIGVVRKSKIPVLVIPENASYKGIQSVVYATDFSYHLDLQSLTPLKYLLEHFKATLHMVHVTKPDYVMRQEDISGKLRLATLSPDVPYKYHTIEDARVEHGIQQFLEQHPGDILAMVAHKHNFLERLFGTTHTKTMLYRTQVPLLVLHDR